MAQMGLSVTHGAYTASVCDPALRQMHLCSRIWLLVTPTPCCLQLIEQKLRHAPCVLLQSHVVTHLTFNKGTIVPFNCQRGRAESV